MNTRKITPCSLLRHFSAGAAALVVSMSMVQIASAQASYPATILADNPAAYYRFEETTNAGFPTEALDSSTNNNNGAYNYNTAFTSPLLGLPGISTNSIEFTTTNTSDYGYVDVPNSAGLTSAAAFSTELWVQPQASPGNGNWAVPFEVAAYPNGWNFYVSGLNEGNGNTSYFYLDMRPGVFQGFPNVPITFFQWYHLVMTFDGTNAITYINGVAQATNNASGFVPAVGSDGHIGSGQGAGWDPLVGGVDEFAFYTNVLTAAQVLNHYNVGTNSFYTPPTPASVATQPSPLTNYSGTTANFIVQGIGTAPLTYQWYSNGAAIAGATTTSYSLLAEYPADNGLGFTAVVSNAYGSQTSVVATLTLLTNLNIVSPPGSITRNVGSFAAFHVTANGALPITYEWEVSTNGGSSFSSITGATSDTYWLSDVQLAQSGNIYAVVVSNPFVTSDPEQATLSVQARQDPPVSLKGYGAIIAADNPVAYWRLDETNGPLAEDAIGTFDGTYTTGSGTITYGVPTGIPNHSDPGVTLANGATIQVPWAPELNPDTAWSAETWISPSSLGANGGDYRIVLSSEYNEYPFPYNGWYLYQQPNGTLAFVPQPGNGFIVAGPDDPANSNLMVPGKWYHVVITDDTTNFYMYINGELRTIFPISGDAFVPDGDGINPDGSAGLGGDDGGNFVIGQRTDGAFNTFEGTVDDTAVYNYALSPQQIAIHYANTENYPTVVLADNPAAYYRFEETTNGSTYPTVALDSTGNGYNGAYNYNTAFTSPLLGLPGISTNSIEFTTTNTSDYGYVDVPNSAGLTSVAAFSTELWVQPQASPGNGNWAVPFEVAAYPNGWNFYVSGIGEGNGNTSYFYLDMRPGVFQGFPNVPITFFQWYHLVMTFDGTNAITYINGVAQATNNASGFVPAVGSDGHIGSGQGAGWDPLVGGVDEFAFYTNVLTAAQILNHYKVGTNSFRQITIPATISAEPLSTTNYSGTSVSFSAQGVGTSPLTYQWYEDGTAISGATNSSYSLLAQYLTDNNLQLTVVVSNAYGSQTSSVATLTLLTNINIVSPPGSITRNVGSYAAFHVTANGALPLSYQWSVSTNGGSSFTSVTGATNDTYWLSDVQLDQSANVYSVVLSNPFGSSAPQNATLTVQTRQDPPVPLTGYGALVVADSPVAYWRLDETNGTLAEDAVGTFDGTYTPGVGSVTYDVSTGIPHSSDPAITLASGATIQVPWAPELNPDTGWSVETWISPSSLGANGGDYRIVLSSEYNEYPFPYNGWYVYQQPSDTLAFVPQPGNGFIVAGPDDPANNNLLVASNWYHVVITDDTTNFNMYINGEQRTSFPVSGDQFIPDGYGINPDGSAGIGGDDGGNFVIGQRTDGAFNTFEGTVDDTAIYNYALSPQQIALHYAVAAPPLTLAFTNTSGAITWPLGVLQISTNLSTGFIDVPGATSPYTNVLSGAGPAFYRVRVP